MFTEAERCLYEWAVPNPDRPDTPVVRGRFDPLAVRRGLIVKSDDKLDEMLDLYTAQARTGTGDDGEATFGPIEVSRLDKMKAEERLVAVARGAFALPPERASDAEVIELLFDFLDYLGKPVATGTGSPNTSRSAVQAG